MSVLSQFYVGGISSVYHNERIFFESGTFTCPITGYYLITAIGGGGSGGRSSNSINTQATGGGAGGLSQSLIRFVAGTVLTYTIGAGGTVPAAISTNGNTGGTTTLTGTGISLTANGGGGGYFLNTTGVAPGATGGTASGGNVMNVTGGGSGTAQASAGNYGASGGGAVGIYGVGYSSGNQSGAAITHGAGVGGTSNATYPGTALYSGTFLSQSPNSTLFQFDPLFNGSTMQYAIGGSGLYPARVLSTRCGISPLSSTVTLPGVGGYSTRGGMFAGGAGNSGYSGGPAGGGGGGGANGNSGAGGSGAVIVEWIIS